MKASVTAKVGMFVVSFSILAVWMLLPAPAQAHTTALPSPTCGSLPDDAFFTSSADIDSTTANLTPSITTQQGVGSTTREKLRYGKITIPALAAGELRVFSTTAPSDAVLCRGSERASSRTSYTAHNNANSAASRARTAADNAALTGASVSTARSALRSAASALTTAANALTAAGLGGSAAATTAATTARDFADDTVNNTVASAFESPLDAAALALETARDLFHSGFQIRATVEPGDESYVLVVALEDATSAPSVAIQFHGAIVTASATAMQKRRQRTLNAGDQHTYPITVTTPGLLTVETTGSTDTSGMLSAAVTAEDDSSGSGDNFKIVAPVTTTAYTVTVDGQTATTTGAYTLDMDFKVAMQTGVTVPTGVMMPAATAWTSTGIAADDTTLQIQGSADEDYFLLTIDADSSGFLTIEATDDDTSETDAATTGTFYGPTGELATDTNSGADSSHFRIRAPVEEEIAYLVKVTGTSNGVYQLSVALDEAEGTDLLAVPGTQMGPESVDCTSDDTGEICPPGAGAALETERFAFNLMESGALYLHTTGTIDTVGTLYGPDGSEIATDDNSGAGNNFRIAANVDPGLHLVEVRGKDRTMEGVYSLVANFVTGAEVRPPTTGGDGDGGDGDGGGGDTTPDPDPTGALDEPPNGGVRSGIGIVRGWVCQDDGDGVQIRILNADGRSVTSFTAPYGSARGDVRRNDPDACDRTGDDRDRIGFAVQYNFNLLAEGTYRMQAFVDGVPVGRDGGGQTNTFRVVRISNQEFLERVRSGRVSVEDFPRAGETTVLEWDQQSQNFQIVDHE